MKITGARVAVTATTAERLDLLVQDGRVFFSEKRAKSSTTLELNGLLLLPGFINAHDHLEFNLFPQLGLGPYPNAQAWASDIYQPHDSPLKEHLSIPKSIRLVWGGLKNLLTGVTTVAHHNAYNDSQFNDSFPIKVVKRFGWAHSLHFSPDIVKRFRMTPPTWPFILHAAEGVDEEAFSEVRKLAVLGLLGDRTILVHGIGLDQPSIDLLRAGGSTVVWCPTSNLNLYGRTLSAQAVHSGLRVLLGTDSALTAQSDLLDEIAAARRIHKLPCELMFNMVTSSAAKALCLTDGRGAIRNAGVADMVAVMDHGQSPAEALQFLRPEMVIVGGTIRLVSRNLSNLIPASCLRELHAVSVPERGNWFTDVDVPLLHENTASALGHQYRLAGKRVTFA